jgi:predicted cobalt transporter CbtA
MTGVSVKLTVFAETPPQPLLNALMIVFEFVLGGPDPITNGFGNLTPFTSILISAIIFSINY